MTGIGLEAPTGLRTYTTATRPTAAAAGASAMIFDSTLGMVLYSDGTNWKTGAGIIVGNSLSANQASIETSAAGWTVQTNCTLAQSSAQALVGSDSLLIASVASGLVQAHTTGNTPVVPGQVYTGMFSTKAAASVRGISSQISWFTLTGAFISSSSSSTVNNSTSAWTQSFVTDVAPPTAQFAEVAVNVFATGAAAEQHFLDAAALLLGSSTTYIAPGA